MSDTQCVQQGQHVAVAHDLKRLATPTGGGLLVFARAIDGSGGTYVGEAPCRVPSGDRWRVTVYGDRHASVYFDSACGDEELWTAGGLWRELQCALRAALREVHPQLFIDHEPAGAEP